MNSRLTALRTAVRKEEQKMGQLIVWTALAMLTATIVYGYVILKDPPKYMDEITQLKIDVTKLFAKLENQTPDGVKNGITLPDHTPDAEVQAAVADALSKLEQDKADLMTKRTRLAMLGVTHDATHNTFAEDFGPNSPIHMAQKADQLSLHELGKLLLAPIVLAVFAWIGTFWMKRYLRLQSIHLFLSTIESDRRLDETLIDQARLLSLLD